MGLPKRPQNEPIVSFSEWLANRQEGRAQPYTNVSSSSRQPPPQPEDEDDYKICVVSLTATPRDAISTLSRNQVHISKRLDLFEAHQQKA